jgi:hypothetical protein
VDEANAPGSLVNQQETRKEYSTKGSAIRITQSVQNSILVIPELRMYMKSSYEILRHE